MLRDAGADVGARDTKGRTALFFAVRNGHKELTKSLLAAGAELAADHLHSAATAGHEHVVRVLLDAGADVAAKGSSGLTALQVAVEENRDRVVSMLVDAGADVAAKADNEQTSLHWAAQGGSKP